MDLGGVTIVLKFAAALIGLAVSGYGIRTAWIKYNTYKKRERITNNEYASNFVSQYNPTELKAALSGYVRPHCSPSDPTNRDGDEYLANTREPLFDYLNRTISSSARFYHLLLADTGMGKTMFCLNYYDHAKKRFPEMNVALVSLARPDALETIKAVLGKPNSILIADAFDEDPSIDDDARSRLDEVLLTAADFRAVIITCRSQFFLADNAIPRETPLPRIVARSLNQAPLNPLVRMYILPFGKKEIAKYISKHFPILAVWRRKQRLRAFKLADQVPDLAYRPMLLDRLPEIAGSADRSHEVYDLYDLLVDGWIDREKTWIAPDDLLAVSKELAYYIYSGLPGNQARLKPDEIDHVAVSQLGRKPEWKHLTARSLLNRDSVGFFKFAHKSILEFLLVKMTCEGDDRPLYLPWTAFMRELLVSWGHTNKGRGQLGRAKFVLESSGGRQNVSPLFDMSSAAPTIGKPDFKRCAERKYSENGVRLAPNSWRSASVEIRDLPKEGIVQIEDNELNLTWRYIPEIVGLKALNLKQILALAGGSNRRLPSYEQFISLVEGLEKVDATLLPTRRLYLLADKPSQQEYLLAEIDPAGSPRVSTQVVDRPRLINGTKRKVGAFVTGVRHSLSYSTAIRPVQLWLAD